MTKKFNIIDILIVTLVVVAVAGVALMKSGGTAEEEAKKLVTLEIAEKHLGFSENVVIGDKVTERVQKKQIGTVVGVEVTPCEKNSYDRVTGAPTVTVIPERENVYVTMELAADADAYVGKMLSVITKHFSGAGYVTEVKAIEEVPDNEAN